MILHTVNKSPYRNPQLLNCLARVRSGDRILLLEDGVYGLNWSEGSSAISAMEDALALPVRFYVLWPDVLARGLQESVAMPEPFQAVSDEQFVDLVVEADTVISWY